MALIVYTTNTGSTEKYAQMLSEKTDIPAVPLSKASGDAQDVIYFGWVMAGVIQGLDEARKKFGTLKAVCAVGMMSAERQAEELKEKNTVAEPLFVLQGAFDMSKLKGMYKMMMGMMVRMIKSKMKESNDPDEKKAIELFEKGFDMVKEENLAPVLDFLNT